jgi:hypothetical protein
LEVKPEEASIEGGWVIQCHIRRRLLFRRNNLGHELQAGVIVAVVSRNGRLWGRHLHVSLLEVVVPGVIG